MDIGESDKYLNGVEAEASSSEREEEEGILVFESQKYMSFK